MGSLRATAHEEAAAAGGAASWHQHASCRHVAPARGSYLADHTAVFSVMLLDLPLGVLDLVASKARFCDRLVLASTCRHLHEASRSPAWWPERRMSVTLRTMDSALSFGWWLVSRTLPTLALYLRMRPDHLPYVLYEVVRSTHQLDKLVLRLDGAGESWTDLRCVAWRGVGLAWAGGMRGATCSLHALLAARLQCTGRPPDTAARVHLLQRARVHPELADAPDAGAAVAAQCRAGQA